MGQTILIVGGCRSGKSAYACEMASGYPRVAYVATAQAHDQEMKLRISKHRRSRPDNWIVAEEPQNVAGALEELNGRVDAIIIDCITLYLTNLILQADFDFGVPERYLDYEAKLTENLEELIRISQQIRPKVIWIANEVGQGIVPATALARFFRDMAGWANQKLAQAANQVYKLEVGIPLKIKGD